MRVCLMIEGQEGVTWQDWVALAETCEQAGLEALFRSDHYTSMLNEPTHGSLDAWATLSGSPPSPRLCGWEQWCRRLPSVIPRPSQRWS